MNPPARDPPPPYPGVGRGNLTTNESLATLESVASAVRNLDGKLNDVRDSLKNEIKSVDKKLSDIQKFIENLPNILEGIVSKDDGGKKRWKLKISLQALKWLLRDVELNKCWISFNFMFSTALTFDLLMCII